MTGSLFIITGPPGAGKSTVSQIVADETEHSVLVAGDRFFDFLATGLIEPWLPESHDQNGVVTEAAAAATARFVQGGYATIYDGVIGPWFLDRFFQQFQSSAETSSFPTVDYAILLPTVERCLERVRSRVGHGFTDEGATTKMHQEFSASSIDARHIIDNADEAAERTAQQLLTLSVEGTLRYQPGSLQ